MHLLYLTFGENTNNHIQAQFSIGSFIAHGQQISSINVLTDKPEFYNNLVGGINIIKLDEETLKDWEGEYRFFWRIKIKAIEMICNLHPNEPVVYLDSDTFAYNNTLPLKVRLDEGMALMHENEGKLSEAKSKTEKKMWMQVRNQQYGTTKITHTHSMWNAGVVATPNKKGGKELTDALEICDMMCKQGVTRRLIEQFALSVSLHENYGLTEASPYIAHYWSNKEGWNKVINEFFIKAYLQSMSKNEMIQKIEQFDHSRLAVKIKVKNTKLRLEKLLEKVFPVKELTYIRQQP